MDQSLDRDAGWVPPLPNRHAITIGQNQVKRRAYNKQTGAKMWESQLRKGSLMLAVLASLQKGSQSAYEIRFNLEQIAGIALAEPVIYPILRRLLKTQFVEFEWFEPEVGHTRRLFRLTSSGRLYLNELSAVWGKFALGMNRMLAVPQNQTPADPIHCMQRITIPVQ